MKNKMWFISVAAAILVSLGGCAPKPVDVDLSVNVFFDGQPLAGAEVLVDGVVSGKTDAKGEFAQIIAKQPASTVKVEVKQEGGKVRTKTWETSFTVKARKGDEPREAQAFAVILQRYVTVTVKHENAPVAGARVRVGGDVAGVTADDGSVLVGTDDWPKSGLRISVQKEGFGESALVYRGESGSKVDVEMYTEAIVKIEAVEEFNGVVKPIKGATVSVGEREVGKTAASGVYTYRQKGKLGNTVAVRISAPGYVPSSFTRQVKMAGSQKVRQFFYTANAAQPRAAVVGFSANTSGEDISDVVKIIEPKFTEELFGEKAFKQVSAAAAHDLIKRSRLNHTKLQTTGWRGTPLAEAVDVLVFGSVSRGDGDSYVVEASFYEPDGKLVMTQAVVLSSTGSWKVGRAMGELVSNTLANYPFSGVVTAANEEGVQVNLGRSQFKFDSDDVFVVKPAKRDPEGRIIGHADGGTYKVGRVGDNQTELRAKSSSALPALGDRVVRLDSSANSKTEGMDKVAFVVTGGGDGVALSGANLYVDQRWIGSTNNKGEATVQLKLGSKYELIVYHHGYEQITKKIEPAKKGERFEFALKSFSSDLTIESNPSGAVVSLDDARIGTTPMTKAYPVTIGFHTMRVDAGSAYRAWEEVVEFNKAEEDRTGSHMITLYKDYLKSAADAEDAHKFDEAIRLYSAAPAEHPDYAEIHNRLGQLYLDDKHDADSAVAEFERVQAIPEVRELVLKQYAVVYTNMGKAYYTKGAALAKTKPNDALVYFAKAIKALDRARENTRFFPDTRHDEAVHDTYYYRAMSYYNLYQITKREALLTNVELAWNEYNDFFPEKLHGNPEFENLRESGLSLAKQLEGK